MSRLNQNFQSVDLFPDSLDVNVMDFLLNQTDEQQTSWNER